MVLYISYFRYPCKTRPFVVPCYTFFDQTRSFLVFTDYGIYWVHRLLHHPSVYKYVHKPHHKWLSTSLRQSRFHPPLNRFCLAVPTPFASHAFHPLDGYLQSVPYHLFIFIFPLHRWFYLCLFVFVNFWSILVCSVCIISTSRFKLRITDPRLRHGYGSCSRESHQWAGAPHFTPPSFHR